MSETNPHYQLEFGLRPFGYSRRNVAVAFAEGRMMLHQLREQVADLQAQLAKLDGQAEAMRAELDGVRAREHEIQRLTIAAEQKASAIEDGARGRAREIIAEAEERAALMRGRATLQAEEVSHQIDELLRVRGELVGSVRAAAHQLEDAVVRIERGEIAPAEVEAAAVVPTLPNATREQPEEVDTGDGDSVFATTVELDAGPFADFAELSAFERALGRMPKVQDVYIRRFAEERAAIEISLAEPAPLVGLLRAVLPHGFEVVTSTERTLRIAVNTPHPSLGSA